VYSNTKTDDTGLQISKEYVQSCVIGSCIMRLLVLNATVLTALTYMPSNALISQQVDDGG
jgi:hypothetical protein